jgi:hypothetical protein
VNPVKERLLAIVCANNNVSVANCDNIATASIVDATSVIVKSICHNANLVANVDKPSLRWSPYLVLRRLNKCMVKR